MNFASQRKIRSRNKLYYRFNHWPVWIWVFFILPGPLTSDLFERGFDSRILWWLAVVMVATGIAGLSERLPGTEARPLIVRFIEDCPNPIHRKICYTIAWGELLTFTIVNLMGLVIAVITGEWHLKEIYRTAYFPLSALVWLVGVLGYLPRARASTRGEGYERRYFYGAVWAVATAHPVLWLAWRALPQSSRVRRDQADHLRWHPGRGRHPGVVRPPAPDAPDRVRRVRDFRLTVTIRRPRSSPV